MSAAAPFGLTGFPLWRRQALAVARLELAHAFSPWRAAGLAFLAFAPTLLIAGHALYDRGCRLESETMVLAGIFQIFYLRVGIFFGCLGIAMRAIRGEVAEKTLHYVLLAPVRREVVVAGKFLAGASAAIVLFGGGTLASFALMYGHFPAGRAFVAVGGGLVQLGAYLLVAALACLGYSSVFLALGLLLRNPVVPAMLFLLWETINAVLPPALKRLSVVYYLKPLFPVELPLGGVSLLFSIVSEPTPPWLAVTGLLAFSAVALAFACRRARGFEISYSSD